MTLAQGYPSSPQQVLVHLLFVLLVSSIAVVVEGYDAAVEGENWQGCC